MPAYLTESVADLEQLLDTPDVLMDVPGVITVARLRFAHGTRYEIALTGHADSYELSAAFGLLPLARIFLRSEDTNTHGTGGEVALLWWVKD